MDTENKPQTSQEICTIRIAFPVETDEHAIECKRKISEVLSSITNVRIEFSLTNVPTRNA